MSELNIPTILHGPTGPYKHGYLMCRVRYTDGEIRNITYHKLLYEQQYGKLPRGMHVHHKNGDKNDNRLENLEALTNQDHSRLHNKPGTNRKNHLHYICDCPVCGETFGIEAVMLDWFIQTRPGYTGPYCSRKCAAKVILAKGRKKGPRGPQKNPARSKQRCGGMHTRGI